MLTTRVSGPRLYIKTVFVFGQPLSRQNPPILPPYQQIRRPSILMVLLHMARRRELSSAFGSLAKR